MNGSPPAGKPELEETEPVQSKLGAWVSTGVLIALVFTVFGLVVYDLAPYLETGERKAIVLNLCRPPVTWTDAERELHARNFVVEDTGITNDDGGPLKRVRLQPRRSRFVHSSITL